MAASVTATEAAAWPAVAGPRGRSTPERLSRMRVVLLAAALLVDLTALVVLGLSQHAVRTVDSRTAPGLLDALAVRAALADADRAVWASFQSGEVALLGPGQDFEHDITTASQRLEHLAELAIAADGELQTIGGQLVNYQSLVEQADASYHAGLASGTGGSQELATAFLHYASNSLHSDTGGLLARVDRLVTSSQHTLDRQRHSAWTGSAVLFLPTTALLLLLAGLVHTQLSFRRMFRRAVSPALAAATVLTVGLAVWLGVVVTHTDRAFGDAQRRVLPALTMRWQVQAQQADAGWPALRVSTATVGSGPAGKVGRSEGLDPTQTTRLRNALRARTDAASATYGSSYGLPVLAAAILALLVAGFQRRMKEYEGWRG